MQAPFAHQGEWTAEARVQFADAPARVRDKSCHARTELRGGFVGALAALADKIARVAQTRVEMFDLAALSRHRALDCAGQRGRGLFDPEPRVTAPVSSTTAARP